jgi:hypothetical protein
VLAFAYRGPTQVIVQYDTSAVMIAGSALLDGVRDAHICGRVKGMVAHDLEIGRVHCVGSMKGDGG